MENSEQNIQLIRGIQRALDENLFHVTYNPILDTANPDTPAFLISANLKNNKGRMVPYRTVRKLATGANLEFKLDRWLVRKAQDDLKTLHRARPNAQLFVPQTAAALEAADYASWLARQQKLNETTGKGLVLSFRLSEVSKNAKSALKLFRDLDVLNISICLSRFPDHPAAFKILKLFDTDYVEISSKLIKADHGTIDRMVSRIHECGNKILISGIEELDSIDLYWSEGADLLSGTYIHPATDNLTFEFPAVIV